MGFPQLIEEDFQCLDQALKDLLGKTEADAALLVEKAGHLIHQVGDQGAFPPDVLATLASNSFNAVQFMAGLLNEDKFPGLYQQGERCSTLMLNVDEHCMLVIIFKTEVSVGAVRFYAQETAKIIAHQIQIAQERAPSVSFDLTDLNVSDVQALFRRKDEPGTPAPAAEAVASAESSAVDPAEPETPMEPLMAKRGPYIVSLNAGTHWWCACGRSQNQPFCDGAHKGTGLKPLPVEVSENKRVALCGCKHTHNPPFCNGSHAKLPA